MGTTRQASEQASKDMATHERHTHRAIGTEGATTQTSCDENINIQHSQRDQSGKTQAQAEANTPLST